MERVLQGIKDAYNCMHVNKTLLPSNFPEVLHNSLREWQANTKAVWLEVPNEQLEFVKVCKDAGFYPHHVSGDGILMAKWLLNTPNKLPGYSTHYIGAGGVVFNNQGEMLLVKNRYERTGISVWRAPGGLVDPGETVLEAAVREVREETSIEARAVGIIGFRELRNYQFSRPDIYFLVLLEALSFDIVHQEDEITEAC